jgi:hypothetical protein
MPEDRPVTAGDELPVAHHFLITSAPALARSSAATASLSCACRRQHRPISNHGARQIARRFSSMATSTISTARLVHPQRVRVAGRPAAAARCNPEISSSSSKSGDRVALYVVPYALDRVGRDRKQVT